MQKKQTLCSIGSACAAIVILLFLACSVATAGESPATLGERLYPPASPFASVDTNASSCSAYRGCPRSAMVWATGTFTFSELLVPSSFVAAANLTLKMSLCCGYKYNGKLLRDTDVYDAFLHTLLQATPFQVLKAEEKRRMFPRERAIIVDTVQQRRYDAAYELTADELAEQNDGDGDVLILVSGAVGAGIYNVHTHTDVPVDIQLKISNRVLKCKCPHTLLVMPMLRAGAEALPPVRIIGLGPHCGVSSQRNNSNNNNNNNDSSGHARAPSPPRIVQLRTNSDGSPQWAVSFAVDPPLLPATMVRWIVVDKATGDIVLDEGIHIAAIAHAGQLLRGRANSSYVSIEPHHTYIVRLTVTRGALVQVDAGDFVMRLPLSRTWPVVRPDRMPHFGAVRLMYASAETMARTELRDALAAPHQYDTYWSNAPREDQPFAQEPRRVPHALLSSPSAPFTLFVGRNDVSLYASDVDAVCDPTLLEAHELWSLQSILLRPDVSPSTACDDDVTLRALDLRRALPAPFPVRVRGGAFVCSSAAPPGACALSGPWTDPLAGTLRMPTRGVAGIAWQWEFAVANASRFLVAENTDPALAEELRRALLGGDKGDEKVIVVRSPEAIVVRRMSDVPTHVSLRLPMNRVRFTVRAPPVNGAPRGRWLARDPLRLISTDERLTAYLDTSRVPNTEGTLPPGTLRFVGEDAGEMMTLRNGEAYIARCPPRVVEHSVRVVAVPPAVIVPALVEVYTERRCVRLHAPRKRHKDEQESWRVGNCPHGAARVEIMQDVLVEEVGKAQQEEQEQEQAREQEQEQEKEHDEGETQQQQQQEEERHRVVESNDDDQLAEQHLTKENGSTVTVCGVPVRFRCEVVWSAHNLVGSATQIFSIRRCALPQPLRFYRRDAVEAFALPSVEWLRDGMNYTALGVIPVAGSTVDIDYRFRTSVNVNADANAAAAEHVGIRSGEDDVEQLYFSLDLTDTHRAAHQMGITDAHFVRAGEKEEEEEISSDETDEKAAAAAAPLLLRRRVVPEGAQPNLTAPESLEDAEEEDDEDDQGADTDALARRKAYMADVEMGKEFRVVHDAARRRLTLRGLGGSAHYPLQYTVRPVDAPPGTPAADDEEEMARRGMCAVREAEISVLALSPIHTVRTDPHAGPLPAPAIAAVPFCSAAYDFSRHPWLRTKYAFDFTWQCPRDSPITVERHTPTHTILRHDESSGVNESICTLTVHNAITQTTRTDAFVVSRVFPTAVASGIEAIGANAARGTCDAAQRRGARARWVVGRSLLLHVGAPAKTRTSVWRVTSVVPASASFVGTQRLIDAVHFMPIERHPLSIGRGGATARMDGIAVAGLYTIEHSQPDPRHPGVCPNVTHTETLHVTLAQVKHKEVVVCGDSALLAAVPIPSELECEFYGQWEMIALQTAPNVTLTAGANFTGVRFDHGRRHRTLVRGLPFGIVTVRWAIYARSRDDNNNNSSSSDSSDSSSDSGSPVMVHYDTMQLLVLTENLPANRIVTLSEGVEIRGTASTRSWAIAPLTDEEEQQQQQQQQQQQGTLRGLFMGRMSPRLRVLATSNDTAAGETVSVERLPIGTTRLQYELHASPRLFGPMLGRECRPRAMRFLIKRVSAFLSATTTLDHECDAYSGQGLITLCLHADGVSGAESPEQQKQQQQQQQQPLSSSSTSSSSSSSSLLDGGAEGGALPSTESNGDLPPSVLDGRVHLVAPDVFEARVKAAAESLSARGCSPPWWSRRDTRWTRAKLAAGRCLSFAPVAARHMSPGEVSQSLFAAHAQPGSPRLCPHSGGDIVPSAVLDGASAWLAGGAALGGLRGVGAPGERFLPIVHAAADTAALERDARAMRPILSLLGAPDATASELDVSGDADSAGAVVTLRLDAARPRHSGGFAAALLIQCAAGAVRGADVLAHWAEVNRPDGRGGTDAAWAAYAAGVRDEAVPCEPLFASLAHMIPRPEDTAQSLHARRQRRVPAREQRLVTISAVEQQLEALRRAYQTTRDGIDVTGLRVDIQSALSRRRITRSQLNEIERARRERAAAAAAHQQQQQQQQGEEEVHGAQPVAIAPAKAHESDNATRLEALLRAYRGITGAEVAALRLTLPRCAAFAVPHTMFLRTALHKDVLCGTRVAPDTGAEENPHALVLFGRLEITDAPPLVRAVPPFIKQCEVEAGPPLVEVRVTGTTFAADPFPADRVGLEELPNPNISRGGPEPQGYGLKPCLALMRAGLRVTTAPGTRKQVFLRLPPCPAFQMLSPGEYDERQDSAPLQARLREPRLLRVTLHGALTEDSHTEGRTSVSFVIEVRPTLARLHVRALPAESAGLAETFVGSPTMRRPLLVCERDVRRTGVEFGIELIGDTWNPRVGVEDADDEEDEDHNEKNENEENYDWDWNNKKSQPMSLPTNNGIRSRMRRATPTATATATATTTTTTQRKGRRAEVAMIDASGEQPPSIRRTPHDVALMNSFSIVEHYGLESAHHILLRHAGLYRSHFVSYLFSTVFADPTNLQRHRFIHRYNSTFIGIRIPAGSSSIPSDDSDEWETIPSIRPFSAVEEILFAIPGIATECRGCLLADATYFVVGDLTGHWAFPPSAPPPLDSGTLVAPLRIPFFAAARVPREWRFSMICPSAAKESLSRFRTQWRADRPQLMLELIVYKLRDMLGDEVPLSQRPTVLLESVPILLEGWKPNDNAELTFYVNASVAERAQAMIASDFLRFGRRHLQTVYGYIRDEYSGGALSVNASVFLKLCAPAPTRCSIVSVTHSLLLVEEPRAASRYGRLRGGSGRSILNPIALLHHAGTAMIGYFILPRVRGVHNVLAIGTVSDATPTRVGLTASLFVATVFLYQMAARLWAVLWTLLWATLFSFVPEPIVGVYFAFHFLYWAFVM